jgi:N-acetyl-gamma-glutamyl-phosphate/LysW-gamma-L-alpha-aminoadipyl-6-phosphate reductase
LGRIRVAIAGGSGYTGGELLRLLLGHPEVEVAQVTSERRAGKRVVGVHPNLRKRTNLTFSRMEDLEPCDVLFLALPHGASGGKIGQFVQLAPVIIDLSADFRLHDPSDYPRWYGHEHPRPDLLRDFVYGIPELHREEMQTAAYISSAGCLATPTVLGLYPLFREGVADRSRPVVVEVKTGSSGAGADEGLASHHPERSGVMRSFKPTGHRHTAEVEQELMTPRGTQGVPAKPAAGYPAGREDGRERPTVFFSATAVEAVRGVLSTSHVFLHEPLAERDLWQVYRRVYGQEPFIRLVKESGGLYRYPEPKILVGSNYCDIGFELDARDDRVVVMAAVDNLMKGAAGQAVQSMNVRCGCPEETGLEFPGLHPV